jgi:antitoxin component of MazEF toxin-antitoxin module
MDEVFKTKVRKIGTSFGVLIPKRMIKKNRIKLGEEIEIAVLKKQKVEAIEKLIGIAKGASPFIREHDDRV